MSCAEARLALGAYVLGALDAVERQAVDAHLGRCQHCRDELAGLAALPGLLGRLSGEEAQAARVPPSDAPLRGALATLSRRRRRRFRLAAVAAVAVLALAGGTAMVAALRPPAASPAATVQSNTGGVQAQVSAVARGWGSEVSLRLTGVPPGTRCSLVVIARDGRREVAATWQVTYAGSARVTGATSIGVDQLAGYAIVTDRGQTLLSIRP